MIEPLSIDQLLPAIVQAEALLEEGTQAEALSLAQRCLAIDPENIGLYHLAAQAALGLQQTDQAADYWQQAIALCPEFAEAHLQLGLLYRRQQRLVEAEPCFLQAIELQPHSAAGYCNLGLVLSTQKRFAEAEAHLLHALELQPDSSEVASNLANVYAQTQRVSEAQALHLKAINLDPASAAAWSNLGVLLADEKQDEGAERCFRQALQLNPEHALARINLGYLLLAQGHWEEGWACHEARFQPSSPDEETHYPILPFPQWHGESLQGKTILVWLEQGYGDVVQFCRYLSLLEKKGATQVTLLCQPPLIPLLEPLLATMAGNVRLLSYADMTEASLRHDFWTFLLSIPFHCGTRVDNIPAEIPYLSALPQRLSKWQARLPHNGLRIGLVWKGNIRHSNDAHRSLPSLETLAPLWQVPGLIFVSLQKGQGEDEANSPPAAQPLIPLGSDIADFADTAAIIAQLDLLICVDTAAAHVAGALGIPCWVMLPEFKTDWRWLRERSDTPWYPGVVRLFRQQERDNWGPVVEEVQTALRGFAQLVTCPATN